MGLLLVTPPAVEPITLAEAKLQCRVDTDLTVDDSLLTALIVAAREVAEQHCERSFITTTWRYYLDRFPCVIRLPRPAIAVQSVQYLSDVDGALTTLASTEYDVSAGAEVTVIREAYQRYWPQTRCVMEAVRVNFTAGYGATAASVPQAIKQALLLIVEHWYENRGEEASMRDIPVAAENLLRRYWHGNYS